MAVHKETRLHTQFDQVIQICLTPEGDGIELTYKESGDKKFHPTLYLDKEATSALMQSLIEHSKNCIYGK